MSAIKSPLDYMETIDVLESKHLLDCKNMAKLCDKNDCKIYVYDNNYIAIYLGIGDFRAFFNKARLDEKDKARLDKTPHLIENRSFLNARGFRSLLLDSSIDCIDSMGFSSLSHSANAVCYVHAKKPVGVDLEMIKPRKYEGVMNFCFSESERECVERHYSEYERLITFYQIYTLKEALIKLLGLDFSAIDKVSGIITSDNKNNKADISVSTKTNIKTCPNFYNFILSYHKQDFIITLAYNWCLI